MASKTFDVLVVGGGVAGHPAAVRALGLGPHGVRTLSGRALQLLVVRR